MEIFRGSQALNKALDKSVVTIGNFDGVHCGHRELIKRLTSYAKKLNCASVVYTFDPHPLQVLRPQLPFRKIFPPSDQENVFRQLGVDYLIIEPFSREFSQTPAQQFLVEYIFKPLNPAQVVVGYDFAFGAGRSGSLDSLKNQFTQLGVDVDVCDPVKVDSQVVSSTLIRDCLEKGEVGFVHRYLERPFYVEGVIEKGDQRGRTIGFPTANLACYHPPFLARGVYACHVFHKGKKYQGMTNVGFNPTFKDDEKLKVETHILNFSDEIYGESLKVEFLHRIREEKKFNGIDELKGQIEKDQKVTEEFFRP